MKVASGQPVAQKELKDLLGDLREGRIVAVQGQDARGNKVGSLVASGNATNSQTIAFMVKHGRGLVSVAIDDESCDRLNLYPIAKDGGSPLSSTLMVSVEAARGTTTGISAEDRALTANVLSDPDARSEDLVRPGHMFPVRVNRAQPGVFRTVAGGSLGLVKMSGSGDVAVICEVLGDSGELATAAELKVLCDESDLSVIQLDERAERMMKRESSAEELEELRRENQQLKAIVADNELNLRALEEIARGEV